MLPAPIFPLAEHARLGQNCLDASISSSVVFCISTQCHGACSFSNGPPFHQLVIVLANAKTKLALDKSLQYTKCENRIRQHDLRGAVPMSVTPWHICPKNHVCEMVKLAVVIDAYHILAFL